MSTVTNLILTCLLLDDDDARAKQIEQINLGQGQRFIHINTAMPFYGNWQPSMGDKPDSGVKWHRVLEHDIFIAAVNYLNRVSLVKGLRQIEWGHAAKSMRLHVCDQEDNAFDTVYTLDALPIDWVECGRDPDEEEE